MTAFADPLQQAAVAFVTLPIVTGPLPRLEDGFDHFNMQIQRLAFPQLMIEIRCVAKI